MLTINFQALCLPMLEILEYLSNITKSVIQVYTAPEEQSDQGIHCLHFIKII